MASKYHHRKLTPKEFTTLLRAAGMNMNDFLYITGRQQQKIEHWLNGTQASFTPTMGDAMILEMAARDKSLREVMLDIADEYSEF